MSSYVKRKSLSYIDSPHNRLYIAYDCTVTIDLHTVPPCARIARLPHAFSENDCNYQTYVDVIPLYWHGLWLKKRASFYTYNLSNSYIIDNYTVALDYTVQLDYYVPLRHSRLPPASSRQNRYYQTQFDVFSLQ